MLFFTLIRTGLGQDLEEGIYQFNSGQTKEAYQNISAYFKEHTQSGLANYYLARLEPKGEYSLTYLQDAIGLLGEEKEGESARLALAEYNFFQGLYVSTTEILNRFKKEYPAGDFVPQALYLLASANLASQQITRARQEFGAILSSFGNSDLAAWAQLGLGDCQFSLGNYSSAALEYQKVLDKYGFSEAVPLALSQLSRCYSELKGDSKAYLYFNLLTDKYPASAIFPEAPLKQVKSRSGAEQMVDVTYTVQLGVFGNQSSAQNLVKTLKSKGYEPNVFSKTMDRKKYTVVQVGSYRSIEEARKAKEKIERETGGTCRVVIRE